MAKLNAAQKRMLRKSSPEAVAAALGRTRKHLGRGRWLGKTNKYKTSTVKRAEADLKSGAVNEGELKQYVAASALPHCTDGWSFLGRAINAHQTGHPGAALHFGYYAELRAAMSFLATQGIGIFSKRHCVVAQPRAPRAGRPTPPTCLDLPLSGTHQVTWLALEYWGSISALDSSDLLLSVIAPAGIRLRDWLSEFVNPTPSQLAKKWLRDWGLDLKQFAEDRNARNEVSYRPTDLSQPASIGAWNASSFLIDFWSLFEPSASRFELLDRQVLRSSLEDIFLGRTGQNAVGNARYEQDVRTMLEAVMPPGPRDPWINFLTRRAGAGTARLLTLAETKSRLDDPEHHLHVLSRAALMLRIATGACDLLMREVDVAREDLSFWWGSLGVRRGLWSPGNEPRNCLDLWDDVGAAVEDEKAWSDANAATDPPYLKWKNERALGLAIMGECERIGLWGLGF